MGTSPLFPPLEIAAFPGWRPSCCSLFCYCSCWGFSRCSLCFCCSFLFCFLTVGFLASFGTSCCWGWVADPPLFIIPSNPLDFRRFWACLSFCSFLASTSFRMWLWSLPWERFQKMLSCPIEPAERTSAFLQQQHKCDGVHRSEY